MSKFKVDLTASDRPERFTEEGDYSVVIENVEKALTQQGFEKATSRIPRIVPSRTISSTRIPFTGDSIN